MTEAELTFIRRMAFHVEAGKSFEDAARAVLDDDQRIAAVFCTFQHSITRSDEQKEMRSVLSRQIYDRLRAA